MEFIIALAILVLGIIVGSFLNVLVIRLGNNVNRYKYSHCLSCGYRLRFFDLIPIISFLYLGGRCRKCKTKISIQYPIVELLSGIVFLIIFFRSGFYVYTPDLGFIVQTIIMMLLSIPMLGMVIYDIKHRIVPTQLSIPFIVLGIIYLASTIMFSGSLNISDIIAGVLLFVPFLLLWLMSRGKWIGMGDVTLIFGIGTMLGFMGGVSAMLFAFWSATLFLILIILPALYIFNIRLFNVKKGFIMKSEIPLVPFLFFGTFLALVFNFDLISLFLW